MRIKKMIAGFLAAVMFQSGAMVVSAEENTSASFVYDDFSVNYEIKNSYGDTDVVDVTLTNTGEETIEDWMLYFDPNGEIQYVTNASEMTADNGSMYFKSKDYNADIAPNSTVTFTYAVNNCTEIPDYYALCQSRIEKTSGYDVSINVNETWGNSFNGSIVINNNTNEPIEAWELTVDTNFSITEITNSWAATVTELDNYQYKLKGTYTSTIDANSSISLGFIGVKSSEPEISFYSLTEIKADSDKMVNHATENYIDLEASTKKLSNEEDNRVVFYADTDLEVDEIELISLDTNEVIAAMKDNGDINGNGDEYMNDGIYSCAVNVDNSIIGDKNFIAVYKNLESNTVAIAVYRLFTQQELDDMDIVDNSVSALMDESSLDDASIEEYMTSVEELLQTLSQVDESKGYALIKYDSIVFNENSCIYEYACGVKGVIFIPNDEDIDAVYSESNVSGNYTDDINARISFDSVGMYGTACIMNGFEPTDYRMKYYRNLNNILNPAGLKTTLKSNITADDLRNIDNYDFISLSMHGGTLLNGDIILVTPEGWSKEKENHYAYELSTGTMVHCSIKYVGATYAVTNKFFEENYSKGSFEGSIIYLQSCEGFGAGTSLDDVSYHMTDTLISLGADTVIGNFNSIYSDFNQEFMSSYLKNLLSGMTTNDALQACRDEHGYDDGDGDGIVEVKYVKDGIKHYEAVPLIAGKTEKYLVNPSVVNGDFENNTKKLTGWKYDGYASISKKMGSLMPTSGNRMALISTRTDEASKSSIYQTFKIPSYAKKLTFKYNVISEEPMEWVGEGYNDSFTAKLMTLDNPVVLASESTDTSSWKRITGINLPGGDNTVYHTGFITVTYDISNLRGSYVKLMFEVEDSGDNTYETAVLIDEISLAK